MQGLDIKAQVAPRPIGVLLGLDAMITAPFAMYGLSDAGAHCGTVCDASSSTSYLTVWARDRRRDGNGDTASRSSASCTS